ncbi:MAG: DUF881 domain-containing protein, partial [Paraclostridium sp.]
QFKTVDLQNKGLNTLEKGEQLTRELNSLKEKEIKLQQDIEDVKDTIASYKNEGDNIKEKNIAKEITKYEKLAGYTNVEGSGVEVKISNGNENISHNNMTYDFDMLLSIINKLNSAKAEAISINDQRIVNETYIDVEGDEIKINDVSIKLPFIIKVIGDKETLEAALKIKYGIVWELEKYYGLKVEIEKKDNVKIDKYSQKINLDNES